MKETQCPKCGRLNAPEWSKCYWCFGLLSEAASEAQPRSGVRISDGLARPRSGETPGADSCAVGSAKAEPAAYMWIVSYATEQGDAFKHQTIFEHEVKVLTAKALEAGCTTLQVMRTTRKMLLALPPVGSEAGRANVELCGGESASRPHQ